MKIQKILFTVLPALGAMLMTGCDSDNIMPESQSGDVVLRIAAPTLTSSTGESEMPVTAGLYIFSDGRLADSQKIDLSESKEISVKTDDKVFCVAGAALNSVSSASTLEDFVACKVSSPEGAQSAPMFFAGVGQLNDAADGMEIELVRGVARIDIACSDPSIEIREIVVENAPAVSSVIPSESVGEQSSTVSYSYKPNEGFDGLIEQAFLLFESAAPVNVRVKGKYDGDPMNLLTRIPAVERNKKYTISVSGGSDLLSSVSMADWQEGAMVEGIPDPGETAIDMSASVIPDGVKIDRTTNSITFPYTGVKDMKLVFVTREPLVIGRRLGDAEKISITALNPRPQGDRYVSEFLINVPAQPKCAARYDATLMMSGSTDFFIDMEVVPSPYQIPTVFIGGHEWMCFNAISNDMDEQLYLSDGMTVDEMYNDHFVDCLGNFFQYGKENPFSPWTSNNPNQFADQTRDIPWQTPGRMPLPEGYHVASFAEWKDLVPNNITVPAKYKCATGDSISVTVVTLPGTLVTPSEKTNAQEFKMRYVLFESMSTGAKLYVPFMGIKANTTDEVPICKGFRFETRSGYWVKDDRSFMLFDFKTLSDGTEGVNIQLSKWSYDGFVGVRGIKN